MSYFTASLTAFGDEAIRIVEVPDEEIAAVLAHEISGPLDLYDPALEVLELIWKYGQNEFQPLPGIRSLSVGDEIGYEGSNYRVNGCGFTRIKSFHEKLIERRAQRALEIAHQACGIKEQA